MEPTPGEPTLTPPTPSTWCYGCLAGDESEYAAALAYADDPESEQTCWAHQYIDRLQPIDFDKCQQCGEQWRLEEMAAGCCPLCGDYAAGAV
jgi:hypothetical protein